MEIAALVVAAVSGAAGLVTLALVLRNELRERRASGPILWDFHRYGTVQRNDDGANLEVAELVQFGRQPTRVNAYVLHGFKVRQEEGYRLRRHVKAEDTLPLYLEDVEADDAWITIAHFPRDDRRWLIVEAVPLEPTSDAMHDRLVASMDREDAKRRTIRGRLSAIWRAVSPKRSIVRPVSPDAHSWARLRTGAANKNFMRDWKAIVGDWESDDDGKTTHVVAR